MLDDLNELRTFRRIAALGSLTAAARDLGVGLAVVSKRLTTLERRAGVRLIQRSTRSLSITDEGQTLLVQVERALDAIESAEERLATGRDEPMGLLRVGAPVSFGRRHVAPVLGRLAARHPRLDVDLRLDDRVTDLIGERIEVAIRIGPPRDSTMIMRRLADNRRILVAAPDYLDRHGRPSKPEDVVGLEGLSYGDATMPWRLLGPGGVETEFRLRMRLRSDSGDAVHDWALAGAGIMLKSALDLSTDLAANRLERVLPDYASAPSPVYALFASAQTMSTRARVFIDAMVVELADPGNASAVMPT
ncbi:LysR family transcriptional regulator [Methylobacterium sp. WL103]|jgi:DNA-binding transcriptional LysR family regulator|uniref:LysR family transcriptional regulator n=1 Tax=Methylobacterium sp. WL103 TaxID=2603891 RepID=UPI0011CAD94D|nr:LysR family transcriptional regulator [Methylobacterium sp. WL103]TXN08720.1 LysR family transcriptional regulator [Methylobacterium sp. WL103]